MAKIKGTIIVDNERCKGCSVCVVACPVQVISLSPMVNGRGYNYCELVDPDNCIGCASCAMVCPDNCITVYRQKQQ